MIEVVHQDRMTAERNLDLTANQFDGVGFIDGFLTGRGEVGGEGGESEGVT